MKGFGLSPRATRDIFVIWNRIARDSLKTADEVEAAIYENCELIASLPELGHTRADLSGKRLLYWPAKPYKNYFIVYKPETRPVEIARVIHAARRRPWRR